MARWLDEQEPDVVALQETKCTDDQFDFSLFTDRGYRVAHHGLDHWNGVAVASRVGLRQPRRGFSGPQSAPFDEARIVSALCGPSNDSVRVVSVYVPNGRELDDAHYLFKLVWLERLRSEARLGRWADKATVICGDFNVAPADQDIYDPKRWRHKTHASPQERAALEAIKDLGFVDAARALHPDTPEFTWWNYRQILENDRGLRIDLALVSEPLWPYVQTCWVDRAARTVERPSDHAPLILELG